MASLVAAGYTAAELKDILNALDYTGRPVRQNPFQRYKAEHRAKPPETRRERLAE